MGSGPGSALRARQDQKGLRYFSERFGAIVRKPKVGPSPGPIGPPPGAAT